MKFFLYTFRTFPFQDSLHQIDPRLIILGKLKEDIQKLFDRIEDEKPDLVIGVALAKRSYVEAKAFNKFGQTKKVVQSDPLVYDLEIPEQFSKLFPVSKQGSSSFCNWSMFQIQHFIQQNNIPSKLCFVHIKENDLYKFTELLIS